VNDFGEPWLVRHVRGRTSGLGSTLLELLLSPPSWLFAAAVETRYALYRAGVLTRHRVPCPVLSVGNLTVGGTGKTPLVEWVVREVRLLGRNPAVLTRGYGAREDEVPDGLAALLQNLPNLRCVRDADRVRGALTAIETHFADTVVLDDGFQHHRLDRQLDLVTVDATDPFGGGHCLPRGLLREPVRALRRSRGVVLTRTDQVSRRDLVAIRKRVRRAAPRTVVGETVHEPRSLRSVGNACRREPAWLSGRSVYLACGIGNPKAFESTVARLGGRVVGRARFRDHHRYGEADLRMIGETAARAGADAVVTTQKDAVKWNGFPADGPPAFALDVGIRFIEGEEEVGGLLRDALRGTAKAG